MAVTKEDVLGYLEKASMLEVSDLIKDIEDKFGVTAAAPVAVAAAPAGGAAPAEAAEEKTASGIIIPDSAKEKPQRGKVVLVGAGKKDEPMEIKVGDTVFYGKYSGTELTIDNVDYLLMSQSDVLYIL